MQIFVEESWSLVAVTSWLLSPPLSFCLQRKKLHLLLPSARLLQVCLIRMLLLRTCLFHHCPATIPLHLSPVGSPWKALKSSLTLWGLSCAFLPYLLSVTHRMSGYLLSPLIFLSSFLCPALWNKSFLLSFWNAKSLCPKRSCEFQIGNSQVKNWLFLSPGISTLLPLFSRGSKCWMLKCLPGDTGVGRRNEGICSARECCLKPQDVFLTHRYYYICPPLSLCPMGLSYALICFKVGAFEDDSVLTCCW